MNVLLIAPGLDEPWTEGRKNLVRDLASHIVDDHTIASVTTPGPHLTQMPGSVLRSPTKRTPIGFHSMQDIGAAQLGSGEFDLALYFPFGSFFGVRKVITERSIERFRRVSQRIDTPLRVILYSIEGQPTKKRVVEADDVLGTDGLPEDRVIPMGISTKTWPTIEADSSSGRRLLFLAGMTNPGDFGEVMEKRGLRTVLAAGSLLAPHGFTLRVSVPMFSLVDLAERVEMSPVNTWPLGTLLVDGESEVPDAFLRANTFVFAYAKPIRAFRPTSVMEAMMSGRGVVLPKHEWLRRHIPDEVAAWFRPNDHQELAAAVLAVHDNHESYAQKALSYARSNFDIAATWTAICAHAFS